MVALEVALHNISYKTSTQQIHFNKVQVGTEL